MALEIKVPLISVNDTSLTVIDTCFPAGGKISKGNVVLVFETSKTTYDVEAEKDGYIEYLCIPGEEYEVDAVIALIHESPVALAIFNKILKTATKIETASEWSGETLFSKGALDIINERGLDKSIFTGHDFINREDVLLHIGEGTTTQPITSSGAKKVKQNNTNGVAVPGTVIKKLTTNKKREIEYLGSVQSAGLTSTINTFIETDGIFVHLNKSLKDLKDSLLPVTIYEAGRLLAKYKELNAFYAEGSICYYEKINVGFAIDIGEGLKVLKVTDPHQKTIVEIEEDIIGLSGKYLDNTLHYEDLTDITFTITDLSSENVAFFRPLINYMNSAILGISSIDGKSGRCVFSVTFDHRVTEGKLVAGFLSDLKSRLESYKSAHFTKELNITCFKCYKSLAEDLSGVGFAKCITPAGEEAFVCQSCLNGY